MIIVPVNLEDQFLISDSCVDTQDSQIIDFINESTLLWLENLLDTSTYLDIVHQYFSAEKHIEYLENLIRQTIG